MVPERIVLMAQVRVGVVLGKVADMVLYRGLVMLVGLAGAGGGGGELREGEEHKVCEEGGGDDEGGEEGEEEDLVFARLVRWQRCHG